MCNKSRYQKYFTRWYSSFALKTNLADLKTEVDKLDIDKLVPVPVDLSKLSNVVKNEVVKKTVYDKLVAKVNNIDTSEFVLKTKYDADKIELERKFLIPVNLLKNHIKMLKLENKIPSISGLVANSALTAVENKTASVSNLVRKIDYETKVSEMEKKLTDHKHDKYITTPEFNKLTAEDFAERLAQADLITKTGFEARTWTVKS